MADIYHVWCREDISPLHHVKTIYIGTDLKKSLFEREKLYGKPAGIHVWRNGEKLPGEIYPEQNGGLNNAYEKGKNK